MSKASELKRRTYHVSRIRRGRWDSEPLAHMEPAVLEILTALEMMLKGSVDGDRIIIDLTEMTPDEFKALPTITEV